MERDLALRILVTGGNGFIGSHVVDRIRADGDTPIVFDRTTEADFLGDIRDDIAVDEAIAHVDAFIHLAGVLGTQETIQQPKPAIMTNITAGLNILEAAAHHHVPGVNIAVGNHWEQNPYSISKSTVERLVTMYNLYRGTTITTVRALNAYGPRQSVAAPYGPSKVRKIIPSFVHRALNGDPIEIYGDGTQIMDMIYVTDVADFLVDTLHHTITHGPTPTVEAGTGLDTTVNEIATTVVNAIGSTSPIVHLPPRPGETPGTTVKANRDTWTPIYPTGRDLIPLTDGIAHTVIYYKAASSF